MVEIEYKDDSFAAAEGKLYAQHNRAMTQDAASALMGFSEVFGQRKMTPQQKVRQEKQDKFNSQYGNITGLGREEEEDTGKIFV